MDNVNLTPSQKDALEALLGGQNVFLTGEAGTGKSYLLKHFVSSLSGKNVLLTAPTGIAAININGATLHRTFKLPVDIISIAEDFISVPEVVQNADIIIIDEISMCRFDIFERVMKIIKAIEKDDVQVVLVGDFLQLPPVLIEKDMEVYEHYNGKKLFAFESDLWHDFGFVTKQLKEVVRQTDLDFITHLNDARRGKKECISYFNNLDNKKSGKPIEVCSKNRQVKKINDKSLKKLDGEACTYKLSLEILKSGYCVTSNDKVVDDELTLKVGAQVMLCVNLSEKKVFNGQIGEVKEMYDDTILVDFEGREVEIERHSWPINSYEIYKDEKGKKKTRLVEVANYSQMPLKLAFAITIHKSQGQTFKEAVVHPDCWLPGQLYVALSRVSSANGLYLATKIQENFLVADQKVLDFYDGNFVQNQKELVEDEPQPQTKNVQNQNPKNAGRKKKFNGLETKAMRLPVELESYFLAFANAFADNDTDGLKKLTQNFIKN